MARPAPQPAIAGKLCRSSELRGSSRQGKANSKQSPQSQEWASWSAGHGTADGRKRLRRMPFVGVLIPPSQGFRRGLSVKLFSFSSLLSPALTALAPSLRPATDALSGAAGCDCGGGQLVRLACRRDFFRGGFRPSGRRRHGAVGHDGGALGWRGDAAGRRQLATGRRVVGGGGALARMAGGC